jgi:predicted lactoylglutathione lyase
MNTKVFVNLPVKDLKRSMDFFSNLGFSFDPKFTDEKAACMELNSDGYVMLLSEPFFKQFINKDIADATKSTEVLVAISADSKEKVNERVDKAISMGATETGQVQDMGNMYSRSFSDLDGHIWENLWMNLSSDNPAPNQYY